MDLVTIKNTMKRELKQRIMGKTSYGNYQWKKADNEWYGSIHDANLSTHENFVSYLKEKSDIKTVLEVGCGTGIYPIKNKEIFTDLNYTGLDISKPNIEFCKQNSNFNFICGDIIKIDLADKYDLVYSHAVGIMYTI